jgi:nucleoside-diphosphate-sugar epimerase
VSGRALVTGATGMLGSYVVERLLAGGWTVRALVRQRAGTRWLEDMGAQLVEGRIEDSDSVVAAARRCDAVFHAAALIGAGGAWESFYRGNVEGTAAVVHAAETAGARLVHVSSTAVYGRARYGDEPTDELRPLPDLPEIDVYGRSKRAAEDLVLEAHRAGRIWATVVRPPVMYGRRDRQFIPRVAPVLARGFFPRIAGGRTSLSLAHAANVAEGALLAAQCDAAAGQVYLLANDHPVTTGDLVRYAEAGLDRRIHAPDVPAPLGRAGFAALRWTLRACGRGDLARHARGALEMLTRDNPFTSARARRELGWSPSVRPDAGLPDAFRWWKETGRGQPGATRAAS